MHLGNPQTGHSDNTHSSAVALFFTGKMPLTMEVLFLSSKLTGINLSSKNLRNAPLKQSNSIPFHDFHKSVMKDVPDKYVHRVRSKVLVL